MTGLTCFALMLLPALYLAMVFHEVGHAVAGRAAGFVVTSLGIGSSRPVFVGTIRKVRVFVCLRQSLLGLTFAFLPLAHRPRARLLVFTSGGIIANAGLAIASLTLVRWLPAFAPFWWAMVAVNAWLAAVNLIPFGVVAGKAAVQSDGATILRALRPGGVAMPAPRTIQTLSALRDLWTSIGDTMILRVYMMSAALGWIDLGDHGRAAALVEEAEALEGATHPYFDCLADLVRAMISIAEDSPGEAESSLDRVANYYCGGPRPTPSPIVDLLRSSIHLLRGEAARAREILEALEANPAVMRSDAMARAILGARLQLACSEADVEAVREQRSRLEAIRGRSPSAIHDLHAYQVLARFHAGRGEDAAEPYRLFLVAVKDVAGLWDQAEGRDAFMEAQGVMIAEARANLPDGEADRILHPEIIPALPDSWPARDRKFRRWGLVGMVLNVACVAAGYPFVDLSHPRESFPSLMIALILILSTMFGALFAALANAFGAMLPGVRRVEGFILMTIACVIPWAGAATYAVLAIMISL